MKKWILFSILIGLSTQSQAECTYRTDRAKDGSYCGERSAEARLGGYEPIIYAPNPQATQPQFNPYFYPATEQEATEFRDYFHTHTANWDNAKKHQTLAWLKAQFAQQKGAAYAERVVSLVELPPLPATTPEPTAQTQIQTTQPQPTQAQNLINRPLSRNEDLLISWLFFIIVIMLFIALFIALPIKIMKQSNKRRKTIAEQNTSKQIDDFFNKKINKIKENRTLTNAFLIVVLIITTLIYPPSILFSLVALITANTYFIDEIGSLKYQQKKYQQQAQQAAQQAEPNPPPQPEPKTTPAPNPNTNPQFAQAMHRAIEKASAQNPPSNPKVPYPNPMNAQENLANWEYLKKQGNDVSNDIIAALRLASEKEKRVGIGADQQQTQAQKNKPQQSKLQAASIQPKQATPQTEADRLQAKLDHYINRHHDKAEIGKLYERQVGYFLEQKGFQVIHRGILLGLEDEGIDLIAKKENRIILVQAKNWGEGNTIHEKHINQFKGSADCFVSENTKPNVQWQYLFVSSNPISPRATQVATTHRIRAFNLPLDKTFPMIKCKVNKQEKTLIYHLPFDQQYDKIIMRPENGDCRAYTIFEAEFKGFRHAHRWRGNQS